MEAVTRCLLLVFGLESTRTGIGKIVQRWKMVSDAVNGEG